MSVLVSDTSVIIDLDRGGALERMFDLPYEFCVPDILFEKELQGDLGDRLLACGLDVVELAAEEVIGAMEIHSSSGKLSFPDSFAFVLARNRRWTLLTGDGPLRQLATDQKVSMHGVLWVLEEYQRHDVMASSDLHQSLVTISSHERCRLPQKSVRDLLRKFGDH